MATAMDLYEINNRRQRWGAFMLSSLALAASVAPRHERAIFQTELTEPKAFLASFPDEPGIVQLLNGLPNGLPLGLFGSGLPRAYLARLLRAPALGPPLAANPASAFSPLGAAAPAGVPTGPAAPDAPFANPAVAGPGAGDSPIGSAFPAFPGDFGPPSTGPAAGPDTIVPVVPTPVTPVVTPPVVVTPTVPQVPAVPEPASWAMMITGFLMVGLLLRRQPRRVTGTSDRHAAQLS